ncbi:MAG TPA: protein-L-isoaspartate(D-aspartate) O-methyltransferase [Actinomycetota bacterium]|nr:protein-L-isoaspartate(D-aspartate) O-methyltransferase [Actinomycetota bacterium]
MPRDNAGLARLVRRELGEGRIAQAFEEVDRGGFVPPGAADVYRDRPVPIPERQTTSQPSLIARMIEAVDPRPGDRVLEVGTGLGYQTALLAKLCREVVSLERWASLAGLARANLAAAGIENAVVIVGDGWKGCPQRAPFDAIVVSAAATEVPDAFSSQLADGGRLVIPVKRRGSDEVTLYVKSEGELVERRLVTPARFVPLVKEEP